MELWALGPAMKSAAASKRVTTGRALAIVSTMAPRTSVAVSVSGSFTAVIVTVLVAMVVSVPLAAELALESVTE